MTSQSLSATPKKDGFYMPAEWEKQQAVWMLWPHRPDNWRDSGKFAQQTFADVARAIAQTTPVFMGVPVQFMEQARATMPDFVTLVSMESDDCWVRDSGPTVVINNQNQCRGIDWQFNAWGGLNGGLYHPWNKDEQVAAEILKHHNFESYQPSIILEGGSIHVDGEGTCLTTSECLLNRNRNPHLSKEQIEKFLIENLNISKFIWLNEGVFMDETDGHIDNICCFVRPGEVVLHWVDDENDPQHPRSVAAYKILSRALDAKGKSLKIWKLPQPGPLYYSAEEALVVQQGAAIPRTAGDRLAGSYVNFLITNGTIVYPLLDPATDGQAHDILQQIFPEYRLIGVPAREILLGGGNIHCITQQISA